MKKLKDILNEAVRHGVVATQGKYSLVDKSNSYNMDITLKGKTIGQIPKSSKAIETFKKMVKGGKLVSFTKVSEAFSKGDKVKYLGKPGVITSVENKRGRIFYSVEYKSPNGTRKARGIYASDGSITEASAKDKFNAPPMNKWWTGDKDALMSAIYHAQRQLPPSNKSDYEKNWKNIVKQLQKKFPAPTAIYKSKLNEAHPIDKVLSGYPATREGGIKNYQVIVSEPMDDRQKSDMIKRAKKFGYTAKPNMGGGVTIFVKEGKLTEAKFYVTYNQGRGMGKKVVNSPESDYEEPRVFKNYNDAEKYVKKVKSSGASPGRITAYWVSDINMNRVDKAGKLTELNEANYGKPYKKGETIKTKEGTTLKVLKTKKGPDFARDEYVLQYLDGKSKGQKFEMWHYMLHNLDLERHPGYKPKGKGRGIKEGFITKYNNKSDMSILSKYVQSFMDWCWETQEDALDVAGMYLDQDEPKLAKNWRAFAQSLVIIYKELKNFDERYAARTKAVLPTPLQKKLENAKFHQGPTTEDNYKQVLKQAIMFMKELKKLK